MVEDRQGNGKLLHDGENGLIAIYFFAIEQWCGNGELLNNSQFLCDRAAASPTFYWLLSVPHVHSNFTEAFHKYLHTTR